MSQRRHERLKALRHSDLNAFEEVFDSDGPYIEGPLTGLLFASKGSYQVKGRAVSFGLCSPLLKAAEHDAELIKQLKALGASHVAITHLDEACLGLLGDNVHTGRVINPLEPSLISGGSSSGSAAAVGAGLVDFALGSDYGGSIRLPSSACGVIGYKPAPGTLPSAGMLSYHPTRDTPGIITKSFEVLRKVLTALNIPESNIPENSSARRKIVALSGLGKLLDSDTSRLYGQAVSDLGDFVSGSLSPDILLEAYELRRTLCGFEVPKFFREHKIPKATQPRTVKALEVLAVSAEEYAEANEKAASLKANVIDELGDGNILLTPSLPCKIPTYEESVIQDPGPLNLFLTVANVAELSAVSFPAVPQHHRIPFSLQLLGRPEDEGLLINIADRVALLLGRSRR